MKAILSAAVAMLAIAAAPSAAQAQVGHLPERSPFRDLQFRQEITATTGYFIAARDPAGVAPQSGPMLGARYEVRVGGPASFTARVSHVFSEATTINPGRPAAERVVGTNATSLWLADAGLTVALTGQKSIRRFVPVVNGAVGLVSNFDSKDDIGGYSFGTTFAFSFGAGVRYVPGGNFQLRADISDYLYRIDYPATYRLGTTPPPVVKESQISVWKHNAALTVGASYLFFR